MSSARILIVGRRPEIMNKVQSLLETEGFVTIRALSEDEALAALHEARSRGRLQVAVAR